MTTKLKAQLIRHEGLRLMPYTDTVGKLTIGVGRNLTDNGISKEEALDLLDHDIAEHIETLRRNIPWIADLDPVRQDVLYNMAFNLGALGLLQFKRTLALVRAARYEEAASAMLQSKWATQVKGRAVELAAQMKTGQYKLP